MRNPEYIVIEGKTLSQILIDHQHWLNEDCEGWEKMRANLGKANLYEVDLYNANLSEANLCGADLYGANLSNANLYGVDLSGADLCGANLSEVFLNEAYLIKANLRGANLFMADLSKADLSKAYLYRADLRGAFLREVNLYGASLREANLYGADLRDAYLGEANLYGADLDGANLNETDLRDAKGSLIEYRKGKILTENIIGYKKCRRGIIVTLEIPRGAIVFSINGNKCRTNKAKVIAIDGSDRAFAVMRYMSYYIGDEFNIYDFDCQYNNECAEGIHFFMTREEAENY